MDCLEKRNCFFFSKKGFNTLTCDLRGNGKSPDPVNKNYDVDRLAKDLNEIILKEGIKKVVLIGFSLGGMVAIDYYRQFPSSVKCLILVNSTYKNVLSKKKLNFLTPNFSRFLVKLKNYFKPNMNQVDFDQSKYSNKPDIWYLYDGFKHTSLLTLLAYMDDLINYDGGKF